MSFENIYKLINKQAAEMLTPEAQQAAMQPAPQDPAAMGAPMDPAAMGGMPPQGAPMDPAMMGAPAGAPPMDPAMAGGMPPQGAPAGQPGAWMQDPMFMQFLQSMGIQVQPDGSAVDPNGQMVPPEMMEQIYAQFQQEMAAQQGGMPPEGAPAEAGMPPEGAPQEGTPPEGEMSPPGMDEETLNQIASVVQEIVDATFEEKIAALDKKITAFTDKMDSIKMLLDDFLTDASHTEKKEAEEQARIDEDLEKDLKGAQESAPVDMQPTEAMLEVPAEAAPAGNMLDIMRGNA